MDKNTSLVKAINKNVRTSPRKLALVCNFIKGKKADIALRDLEFSRKRIARDVSKTVKSAISNAVQVITYCQLRVEVERASMMIKALDKEGIYGRGQADTGSSDQGVIQGDNTDRSLEQDSFGHRNVMEQDARDK